MDSASRPFWMVVLLAAAGVFFWLHFTCEKSQSTSEPSWKYRVTKEKIMPYFHCEKGQDYSFLCTGDIKGLRIDSKYYSVDPGKMFVLALPESAYVSVDFRTEGYFINDGYVEIQKGRCYPVRLLFLQTDYYDDFAIPVRKGQRLNLPRQQELTYIAYVQKQRIRETELIKNDDWYYFRFFQSEELRFRAAEVPFLFVIKDMPFFEPLQVNNYNRGLAFYFDPGEEIKTDIWLDPKDSVYFGKQPDKSLLCSTTGGGWKFLYGNSFKAVYEGYLRIKCNKRTAVTFLDVDRNRSWYIDKNYKQARKIKVYPGDVIQTSSSSRYYVNGQILEAGLLYTHRPTEEGFLEIKASVDPRPIEVEVKARRGI